ncbi:uncharacterized protein FIBRA_02399 [Fibroporia radiculosa]|uniref:Actin-like ATPase domain-containing protein n=1 Tax=Fibroporia radiculosa TaxID=599839 RepID=J4H1U2_9APHY|nr:uncharacterized protein FIBRA_02399 [Fibroporia radiculosa]CCM00369.1 predicted protein [Fibroporia radiculosa]
MSSNSFRDSIVVVLDTSRSTIKAGLGLHDLLRPPSIEILARVGLPRNATVNSDIAMNGTSGDAHDGPSTSKATSPAVGAKVTDYLVGTQLDEAVIAEQDLAIFWPFAEGDISDWVQAEALWKYVLFNLLHLRRMQMESPVLLSLPCGLSRGAHEHICQLFFERFNVAAFSLLERPTAQFYAAITATSQLSGVVVDIDRTWTDVTPIYDGVPVHAARVSVGAGLEDCVKHLAAHLASNQNIVAALAEPPAVEEQGEGLQPLPLDEKGREVALEELARQLWTDGLIRVMAEGEAGAVRDMEELSADNGDINIAAIVVAGKEKAVIESGMRKKAARASAVEQARAKEIEARDLVEVSWRGRTITIGRERHRFCEPLFDVSVRMKGKERERVPILPLHTAVGEAVNRTEVDQRAYIWQGLFVTGDIANHVKGMGVALQARLSSFITNSSDPQHNEVQPRAIRTLKIPDYFAEYRERGDGMASFLGSSIVAKITFSDSAGKNFVSKSDYTNQGPRAVLGMSPSML